jgi:hypothetical protein
MLHMPKASFVHAQFGAFCRRPELRVHSSILRKESHIMKHQLLRTLIVASFATMACSAGAENATPRELPNGATPTTGTQNGTPAQTPPAGSYQSGTSAYPSTGNSQAMRGRMTNEQMRDYMDARKACGSQPAPQMEICNNDVNKKYSSVDAKCQKVSGPALGDCLRGADHGG